MSLGEGKFSWVGAVLVELNPAEPGGTPPDELTSQELQKSKALKKL